MPPKSTSSILCRECLDPIPVRKLSSSDPSCAIHVEGEWMCRKCYNHKHYLDEKSKEKCVELPIPSFASPHDQCLFSECPTSELVSIHKDIRDACCALSNCHIEPHSLVCAGHLKRLESREFSSQDLTPFSPITKLTIIESSSLMMGVFEQYRKDIEVMKSKPFTYLSDEQFQKMLFLTKEQFKQVQLIADLESSDFNCALAFYLFKLCSGMTDKQVGAFFTKSQSTTNRHCQTSRGALEENFLPKFLGFTTVNREFVLKRTTDQARQLYSFTKAIAVCDSTYVYIQKSADFVFQKDTFCLFKSRHLFRMFMTVTTDGWILDVSGPFQANLSDSDLIETITNNPGFSDIFLPNESLFLIDRGFFECQENMKKVGLPTLMPAFIEKGDKQLTTEQANESRICTKGRCVVEMINGKIKQTFSQFNHVLTNKGRDSHQLDFKIACALLNFSSSFKFCPDKEHPMIPQRMRALQHKTNKLAVLIEKQNLFKKKTMFSGTKMDEVLDHETFGIPRLNDWQLNLYCCGSYQLKWARSYYAEHISDTGKYFFEVSKDLTKLDFSSVGIETKADSLVLLRAKLKSRHSRWTIYRMMILIDKTREGIDRISETFCSCKVGRRTIGCCAHLASVIWYFSNGRYLDLSSLERKESFFEEVKKFAELPEENECHELDDLPLECQIIEE